MRQIILGLLGGLFLTSAVHAEPSESFSFYLGYLEKLSQASSLDDVLAYQPGWWQERYAGGDAAAKQAALDRLRSLLVDLEDVKLEKEEAAGAGTVLHMTAHDQNDLPMRGKVTLVEEDGSRRIDESMWASAR